MVQDKLYSTNLSTAADVINNKSVQQGDVLFLSLLGKTSGSMGGLFYRLGVLKTYIRDQQLLAGTNECEFGQAKMLAIDDFGAAAMYYYDESSVVSVIGFDYFISAGSMLRTEIEYMKGHDNLTVTTVSLGLRYNF